MRAYLFVLAVLGWGTVLVIFLMILAGVEVR